MKIYLNKSKTLAEKEALAKQVSFDDRGPEFIPAETTEPVNIYIPDHTKVTVFPDIHFPAAHTPCLQAVLRFNGRFQPDILDFDGDILDGYVMSRYSKKPGVATAFTLECAQARNYIQDSVKASGAAFTFWKKGNHDERPDSFINENVQPLAFQTDRNGNPILHFFNLVGLDSQSKSKTVLIKQGALINDRLWAHHGHLVKSNPGETPFFLANLLGMGSENGHTHRAGEQIRFTTSGEELEAYEHGFIARSAHPQLGYVTEDRKNWQLSFATKYFLFGRPYTTIRPIIPLLDDDNIERLGFRYGNKIEYCYE
jgi:hypothetical protein